jgi:hypothetical protein
LGHIGLAQSKSLFFIQAAYHFAYFLSLLVNKPINKEEYAIQRKNQHSADFAFELISYSKGYSMSTLTSPPRTRKSRTPGGGIRT